MEYANQVWAPRVLKHIDMIENVQRRATKLIPGFKNLSYEERLRKLKLPSLTYRRLRGDLIEMYKIISGKYDPEVCEGFIDMRQDSNTRGNKYKVFKHRPNLNIRKYGFPHRIVDIWNDLPNRVVIAETKIAFKIRLDNFLRSQDMYYNYRANYSKPKQNSDGTGRPKLESYIDLVQEAS